MKTRNIVINKISEINAESLRSGNTPAVIRYLDTSSITRNRIEGVQTLDSRVAPFPSRAQRKVKNGTIIYSTVRPEQEHFGFINNSNEDLIVSTGFLTIDLLDKNIDPKYLYYLITQKSITNHLQRIAVNNVSSYPSINPDDLGNLEFVIPDERSLQVDIASVLSTLDAKKELNQRINVELEAMAKTLYDYWFVQFDFPDKSGKPYKSSGGKMVWNSELKRDLPDGWKVENLGMIEKNIITGKTPPKVVPEYFNGEVPFVTIGDIRGNMYVVKTEETLSKEGADYQSNKYINKGAICVTCIASPGLVGFASELSQTNQQINSIQCERDENRYYLYFAIKTFFETSQAKTGNTFANMNKGDFASIRIILPSPDILLNYAKFMRSNFDMILNNSIENMQLSELRDWLLPMLMNGQVKVN